MGMTELGEFRLSLFRMPLTQYPHSLSQKQLRPSENVFQTAFCQTENFYGTLRSMGLFFRLSSIIGMMRAAIWLSSKE